jgi:hypothetical protein
MRVADFCRNVFAYRRRQFHAWSFAMPMRGELPIAAARACIHQSAAEKIWLKCFAIISNRDLHFVVGFCAAEFLLTVNVVQRFPDFGQTFAALQVFPG